MLDTLPRNWLGRCVRVVHVVDASFRFNLLSASLPPYRTSARLYMAYEEHTAAASPGEHLGLGDDGVVDARGGGGCDGSSYATHRGGCPRRLRAASTPR